MYLQSIYLLVLIDHVLTFVINVVAPSLGKMPSGLDVN
jgi:hypothetical protein